MLRSDKYNLLWSTEYDEEVCSNIYNENCNQCEYYDSYSDEYLENKCPYRMNGDGDIDYDFCNDRVMEEFGNKFITENDYQYFVIDRFFYKNVNGKEIHKYSDLIGNLKDVLNWLSDGVGMHLFRIYYDGYNRLLIELSHHDGSEYYTLARLSKYGQELYDKGYDFNYCSHCVKGVVKDFKDLNFYINR